GDAGWLRPRLHRSRGGVQGIRALVGGERLRGPHHRPRVPPGRYPRPAAGRASMTATARGRSPNPVRQGWSRISTLAGQHHTIAIIVGMAIFGTLLPILARVPPFNQFQPFNAWLDGFS